MIESSPPSPLPDAPVIPGYRILRKLGRGGMATVYLALQESLNRQVAIKVMLQHASLDELQAQRFEHEAHTIARLEHPHIVHIHEIGRTQGGLPYYVMAYLPRGDLGKRDLSQNQPAIIALLRNLLDALAYAHARGVVHRDVKAENVLFDSTDRPQLADFGIALSTRAANRLTSDGMTLGSCGYMSPEQARGERVDARADLYSVGVLCYEMLAGRLPFQANDTLALAMMHCQEPIPRLPRPRRHWQQFIDRAMAKAPEQRFRNAIGMRAALDGIERRVHGGRAGIGELWHRLRSGKAWRGMVLIGALAVLLVLGIGLLRRGDLWPLASTPRGTTDTQPSIDKRSDPDSTTRVNADDQLTAAALPVEASRLDLALQQLQSQPDDAIALRTVARQLDWLGSQVDAEWARSDHDRAAKSRQLRSLWMDASSLRLRAGSAVQADFERFQRTLKLSLETRERLAISEGRREDSDALQQLLIELELRQPLNLPQEPPQPEVQAANKAMPKSGKPVAEAKPAANTARQTGDFVTRADYAAFVRATRHVSARCRAKLSPFRLLGDKRNWRNPGVEQADNDPVLCVSASDALAYLSWASQRDGRRYHLPAPDARPQNRLGLAEWTNRCVASTENRPACSQRIAAGPLAQEQTLDAHRGYDDVTFRRQPDY